MAVIVEIKKFESLEQDGINAHLGGGFELQFVF